MNRSTFKYNERAWSGQIISWIKLAIENGTTIFKDVNNDASVKMKSGKTLFPDILLFVDKVSGIVFNGWELKFPDTAVDDEDMLQNALEKAKNLQSSSFVTWNGAEAIIWGIDTDKYDIESLSKIKVYPKEPSINNRDDMAIKANYDTHEDALKQRTYEILHDLGQLYQNGKLKPAINISDDIICTISDSSNIIIPQFEQAIKQECGKDAKFRKEFKEWKRYESATLKILASSSRRAENIIPEKVLAKFAFYNLIGKTLFYFVLSENLSGILESIVIGETDDVKQLLNNYFEKAKAIDYQAVFKPYFTDNIEFSEIVNTAMKAVLSKLCNYDLKILPSGVIGNILENLVPEDEKLKFGQYFTSETLANLVAFPVVQTNEDLLFDPTSGTGTFLSSFYNILNYYNNTDHSKLLEQIWGNDISHFPAILSVINLYKHNVTKKDNFPRVIRSDYFNLEVGKKEVFPDPIDYSKHIEVPIPQFDGIASNLPFIQQEDIPNDKLTVLFKENFEQSQRAFLHDGSFKINERSDYYTYCIYHSIRFLKDGGMMSVITSNAWLGKEYGLEFKRFLLDNFHIKYVVKSNAEHWFSDSQVSTIFFVLEKKKNDLPTRFITLNFKLKNYFDNRNIRHQFEQIEELYDEIDRCNEVNAVNWSKSSIFNDLFESTNGMMSVCVVSKEELENSITYKTNWNTYFTSANIFASFYHYLTCYYPSIIDTFRGERTGWDKMFVIPSNNRTKVSDRWQISYVKSPTELDAIKFVGELKNRLLVCDQPLSGLDRKTVNWIRSFENVKNKNGSKTIQEACKGHKPFWWSLRPKQANIFTAINPYTRFFFTYSDKPVTLGQRLIGFTVNRGHDVKLIAALLNSAITFLTIELKGVSRNLGVLDLNADFFKELRFLNPELLNTKQKQEIIEAFEPITRRNVEDIFTEIQRDDRKNFDRTILRCFGIKDSLLGVIYNLLIDAVNNRISMKDRSIE